MFPENFWTVTNVLQTIQDTDKVQWNVNTKSYVTDRMAVYRPRMFGDIQSSFGYLKQYQSYISKNLMYAA